MRTILCLGILAALAPAVAQAQRPFPDTRSGIHIFYDQLYDSLSPGRFRFAATHYVGCQKMRDVGADALRQYDPGFLVLHYQLGMGAGPADLIVCTPGGSDWGSDWPTIDANEPWFIHDDVGNRCLQLDWGWYLMDLMNPQWLDYWATTALERVACTHADGVFADSTGDPWNMSTLPAWLQTDPYAFGPYVDNLLAYASGRFAGQAYMIPNAGPLITTLSTIDYALADGVMVEGFVGWNEASQHAYPGDWKLEMDRIIALSRGGDIVLCQTNFSSASDTGYRMYTLATYLLVKGAKTTFNAIPDDVDPFVPVWFPEWELPVGASTAPLPSGGVDALFDAAWGVYRRDYTNALVLVNPSGATVSVALGGTYHLPVPSGGGEVDVDGNPSGTLTYQPITSATLPPRSGVVLVVDPAGPPGTEVVMAPGAGAANPPRVRAVDGSGTTLALDVMAYAVSAWGASVAAGAIDTSPADEVLTGPGPGAVFGPQVRAFDASGAALAKVNFYAYGTLKYGARPASATIDAESGYEEILTAPGPGAVFGPHVRGWNLDGATLAPLPGCSFYAYQTLRFGCHVTAGDLDGGSRAEIVTGTGPSSIFTAHVRGFRYDAGIALMSKVNFNAFAAPAFGARVAAGDVEDDGFAEMAVTPVVASGTATLRLFDYDATQVLQMNGGEVAPFAGPLGPPPGFSDTDGDGAAELLAGAPPDPAAPTTLRAFDYSGSSLDPIPALWVDPFGLTYGLNPAGATLD